MDEEAVDVDRLLHVLVATDAACPAVRCPPPTGARLKLHLTTALLGLVVERINVGALVDGGGNAVVQEDRDGSDGQ
eukprot:14733683-Heterocapsa_arctica.AAC.1